MREYNMEFQNFYMIESESISTIKLNLKTDLKGKTEIQYAMYKNIKNYLIALSKIENTTIKQITIGDLKTSKILEPSFIMHKWNMLYEIISIEFIKGGNVYLIDVGSSDKNPIHYYYIGNDKKFFNKYGINSPDIIRVVKEKIEEDKYKQIETIKPEPSKVEPKLIEKTKDWGYFGIDGSDLTMIHDAILKNKNRKNIHSFLFQNKIGEGYKYKIEGSDEDTGVVYMIAFNDKSLGGVLVFYKPVSFKIAYELGMFKGLEIGNDYPYDAGRKRQLRNIDQLYWQEISPVNMIEDKDPVKKIEAIHKESKDCYGNILNEMHNISVIQICDYLNDFEFNK